MIYYKFINPKEFEKVCNEIFEFFKETIGEFYQYFYDWYYKKVCPEFFKGIRKIIIALDSNFIIGVSILKISIEESKICSFKVREIDRNKGIGFNLLSRSLDYFNSIGVSDIKIFVPILKNNIDSTIRMCKFLNINSFTATEIVRREEDSNKLEIIFNIGNYNVSKDQIIMSIRKKYSDQIISNTKRVEFRRKPIPDNIKSIIINATGINTGSIISGIFNIKEIIKDTPKNLWNRFKDIGGISRLDYDNYFSNCDIGYAILVDNVVEIGIKLSTILGDIKSPQFYRYLK